MVLFEMLVRRIKWVEHSDELMSYCLMNGRENEVPELMGLF